MRGEPEERMLDPGNLRTQGRVASERTHTAAASALQPLPAGRCPSSSPPHSLGPLCLRRDFSQVMLLLRRPQWLPLPACRVLWPPSPDRPRPPGPAEPPRLPVSMHGSFLPGPILQTQRNPTLPDHLKPSPYSVCLGLNPTPPTAWPTIPDTHAGPLSPECRGT